MSRGQLHAARPQVLFRLYDCKQLTIGLHKTEAIEVLSAKLKDFLSAEILEKMAQEAVHPRYEG